MSSLGLAYANCSGDEKTIQILKYFQKLLFNIGFYISGSVELTGDEVVKLETIIDEYMENMELKGFILPGGDACTASIHLARSIVRRAERRLVAAIRSGELKRVEERRIMLALKIINRLSDALFAIAFHLQASKGLLEYI